MRDLRQLEQSRCRVENLGVRHPPHFASWAIGTKLFPFLLDRSRTGMDANYTASPAQVQRKTNVVFAQKRYSSASTGIRV